MSKVDAQRAMREARFAAYRASLAAAAVPGAATPSTPARVTPTKTPARPDAPAAAEEGGEAVVPALFQDPVATPDDAGAGAVATGAVTVESASLVPAADPADEPALCGHRNMGNKSCRRPAGHPEKNHRYT